MSANTDPAPSPPRRPVDRRRALSVAAAAAVLGAGVWGVAAGLDSSPAQRAEGPRALSVGVGATPGETTGPMTTTSTSPEASLPPLTIILDRPAPDGIGNLDGAQQVLRLRDLIAAKPAPRRYVELGRAQLELGDVKSAETSFRAALRLAPKDPAARTGVAFTDFASSSANRARAMGTMARLAREYPKSQLVAFNQGWLAAYGRDPATVSAAWSRTVRMGPRTPLGRVAAALLKELADAG